MDLHSFVFKCAHALLKRTMEGFFFSSVTTPSLLVQLISQLSRVVITEIPRALFSGACQIISTASTLNASQPNNFSPLSLSLSTAELFMSLGSCFSLWFGSSGWLSQRNQLDPPPPLLFPAHTCLCVCPCWGHFRRTVGVMRSQTALNGPKQAVRINNLLWLQSCRQEQHSVKCQQQTP